MAGATGSRTPDNARDLLLADHKYIGEWLRQNEQGGETRFNIFVSLVTGGIGGIVALLLKADTSDRLVIHGLAVAGFASLLVIGCVIWLRMIKREIASDGFKAQLDMIRDTFRKHYDGAGALEHYDLFPIDATKGTKSRSFGGLTDTVAALNGLLAAGLTAAATIGWSPTIMSEQSLSPTAAAILVGIVLFYYQHDYANREEAKGRPSPPTHAGGVVYDKHRDVHLFLVVGPLKDADGNEWVLPQGHIRPKEEHAATAIREVEEETGIIAASLGLIHRAQFEKRCRRQDVKFYLLRKLRISAGGEKRAMKWLKFNDALSALSYDESKAALRKAEARLKELGL